MTKGLNRVGASQGAEVRYATVEAISLTEKLEKTSQRGF